jgi:DNA polymerase-3 subunit delta
LAIIRETELLTAVKRNPVRGLLIYGSDLALVTSLVDQVLKTLAAPEDVTRLSASTLRDDPARLDDVVRAQSFLGGRQAVLLEDVGDQHVKLLEPYVTGDVHGNFLLITASSLSKGSALRTACEAAQSFLVLPVYEDKPADILERVKRFLKDKNLQFVGEAEEIFMSLAGTDRTLALQEAAKLSLYCWGRADISEEDVAASCGDQAKFDVDGLIDAALSGDLPGADRILYAMDESDWGALLPLLGSHLARLGSLRGEADRLGSIEQALKVARPPIFFGRKNAFTVQLRTFDLEALVRAQIALDALVEQTRRLPRLSRELVSRFLLSLSVEARRSQRKS